VNQMRDAFEKSGIDLGGALIAKGNGAPPVIDAGTFSAEPSAQPVVEADPTEARVLAFLKVCHLATGLTYREISGGTGLQIPTVKDALEQLVAAGAVRHDDAPEQNFRRHTLTASVPAAPSARASEPTAEERWARESRQRVLAAEASQRKPEQPQYSPTEEEISAELERRKKVTPLTDAERKQLELGAGRVPINPQIAVRK
jgi:hypothetical protein